MDSLYIVPDSIKKQILETHEIKNILASEKFMTKEELIKNLTFIYDEEAIYYLMKNYKLKYDTAKIYLENIYYVWNDVTINDSKINFLNKLKEELLEKNLLHQNPLINNYLSNYEIFIKGYRLSKFEQKILSSINYSYQEEKKVQEQHKVYEFETIQEEVDYVLFNIIEQLKTTDISNIKLIVSDEYLYPLKRTAHILKLPLQISSNQSLYGNIITKEFLELLNNTKNVEETVVRIVEKYSDFKVVGQLIDICNSLPSNKLVNPTYLEYITHLCKTKKIKTKIIKGIECFSYQQLPPNKDNQYIYMLGFNGENVPKIYKDEDYISNTLKEQIGIDTSYDLNLLEKENLLDYISQTKNLTITYKLKTPFMSYTKSNLLEEMPYEVVIKESEMLRYNYSHLYNQIELTKQLDNLVKYNIKSSNLDILYKKYSTLPYKKYSNKFTGISKKSLNDYINNNLSLSYTSLNNYYLCQFKYYISNILKLDIYEETFMTEIGNLFHEVLSKMHNPEFQLEKEYQSYLEKRTWTSKEQFFLSKLKEELEFIIETIKYQQKFSTCNQFLTEKKFCLDNIPKVTFKGIVDKITYKQDGKETILSIVDYKTGHPDTSINNVIYGLNMQLPIYLYLIKNSPQFQNAKIAGFYLQKLLNPAFSYDGNEYEREKRKHLRLDGYSLNEESILEQIDCTYKDSELIKGMKIGKSGFYSTTKVLSNNQMEQLDKLVLKKIEEASQSIFEGDFKINPKRIGDKLVGCEYCPFSDICFRKEEDIVNLKKIEKLDFLGGE